MIRVPLQKSGSHLASAASSIWGSVSRSKSTSRASKAQSVHGLPLGLTNSIGDSVSGTQAPIVARHKTTMALSTSPLAAGNGMRIASGNDEDANSTVVDSHPVLISGDHICDAANDNVGGASNVEESDLSQKSMSKTTLSTKTSSGNSSIRAGNNSNSNSNNNVEEDDGNTDNCSLLDAMSIHSGLSHANSITGPANFMANNLPTLDPYVDPYKSLQLPEYQLFNDARRGSMHPKNGTMLMAAALPATITASSIVDKRLLYLASESLKSMVSGIPLDRERLEFLREGLTLGGITAATI
ncbi:hypothetical protein GGF37_007363, partial [Kickxella alabastrina]